MALILKDGSVFLHIPKTGGSFVSTALIQLGLVKREFTKKHADVDRFINKSVAKKLPPRPFMFCFVRNPLKWYESWWKYNNTFGDWPTWGSASSGDAGWHPQNILNGCGDTDFSQFVRNVLKRRPGYVSEMYGWYVRPDVGFVGKNENLIEDLVTVLRMRELDFDEDKLRSMAKVGVAPGEERINWSDDLRREVIRLEYPAFVRYGYPTE